MVLFILVIMRWCDRNELAKNCFEGDLDENGVRLGMGHLEIRNGSTFNGSFDKGLPNGIGVMRFPDSSRYEGEFMQGWFHGYGVFSTIDGMKFEGEFRW